MPMSPKRRLFCDEYMVDRNATQAAKRAGYSPNAAKTTGAKILKDPECAAYIEQMMHEASAELRISAKTVLAELAEIGLSDMANYMQPNAKGEFVLDMTKMPVGASKCISEMTQETFVEGRGKRARDVRRTKIKLHDKNTALTNLCRHFQMFTDKMEISADGELADLLRVIDGKTRGLPGENPLELKKTDGDIWGPEGTA